MSKSVKKKLRGGPVIDVDMQVILWRKAKRKREAEEAERKIEREKALHIYVPPKKFFE